MSWGLWIYKSCPVIGDWIKVDCTYSDTLETRTFQGLVVSVSDNRIVEICPRPPEDNKYFAKRWAKKALSEGVEVMRKATVDA